MGKGAIPTPFKLFSVKHRQKQSATIDGGLAAVLANVQSPVRFVDCQIYIYIYIYIYVSFTYVLFSIPAPFCRGGERGGRDTHCIINRILHIHHREGVYLLSMEKGDALSCAHRRCLPPLYNERGDTLSFAHRRSLPPQYRKEERSLLLISRESTSSLYRGGRLLLYEEERVSLFVIQRGQTPSRCRGDSGSLLYRSEVDSFSKQRRKDLSAI